MKFIANSDPRGGWTAVFVAFFTNALTLGWPLRALNRRSFGFKHEVFMVLDGRQRRYWRLLLYKNSFFEDLAGIDEKLTQKLGTIMLHTFGDDPKRLGAMDAIA